MDKTKTADVDKISLKQVQLSAQKFNQVAVPHHLGLLKNHKTNIEKCLALGDWTKIKKEEINATRVIRQLRNLLYEMDVVRRKVEKDDIEKFDQLIKTGKNQVIKGINEFLELQLKSPSQKSNDICGNIEVIPESYPQIQNDYKSDQELIQMRESCLIEFENLQQEIEDLNEMFHCFQNLVHEQGEDVDVITNNAEEAFENIQQGEMNLRTAIKYRKAMYPVVGAILGTCIGGPIGLVAGLKAGSLAAIGCGILGFTGASVLKNTKIVNGSIIGHYCENENKKET